MPGAEFLTGDQASDLLELVYFPRAFRGASLADTDYPSRLKHPYTSAASVRAVHGERLLELVESIGQQLAMRERPEASLMTPFAPRGQVGVPIAINNAVKVLSITVPTGYVWWLDGYAFNLFPSAGNELNYNWQLRVEGQDILNKGQSVLLPGRPIQAAQKVPVGYTQGELLRCPPGTEVEVIVTALNTLAASDSVAATVFGFLEGVEL